MAEPSEDVTALLADISSGNQDAWNRLLSVVYQELHSLAQQTSWDKRPGKTLQTTALVNEAFIRLVKHGSERWENRTHFFRVASRAMRQILVDEYRRMKAIKRGDGKRPLSFDELSGIDQELVSRESPFSDWEALNRALDKLDTQECHKRKCTIVELRFFVGLTHKETAEVMGVSTATVKRDWEFTRAWLAQEMQIAGHDNGIRQEN